MPQPSVITTMITSKYKPISDLIQILIINN